MQFEQKLIVFIFVPTLIMAVLISITGNFILINPINTTVTEDGTSAGATTTEVRYHQFSQTFVEAQNFKNTIQPLFDALYQAETYFGHQLNF